MNTLRRIRRFLCRFGRDDRGGTIIIIAAAAVPMVAFMGISVDTARGYVVKQRLNYAIDGAALAAARSSLDKDYAKIGRKFFDANFPSGFMGVTGLQLKFTLSGDKRRVTVDIDVNMPTTLMRVVGIDDVDISLQAVAQRESTGLELAIALDNTGSMSKDIQDLKVAAGKLLDILYGKNDTVENLWVALLPFDARINLKNYTNLLSFSTNKPRRRRNTICPESRRRHETGDSTPSEARFTRRYRRYSSGCQAQPVLALTQERSKLDDVLKRMTAKETTRIDIAAAWAFRMVSPKWRGLWGDPNMPLDYNAPNMDKAVIIMTDGENQPKRVKRTADRRLSDTCGKMKAKGIIVYTIQFRETSASLRKLLRECATSPNHYYHAAKDELDDVFVAIANQLSNLRLVN